MRVVDCNRRGWSADLFSAGTVSCIVRARGREGIRTLPPALPVHRSAAFSSS